MAPGRVQLCALGVFQMGTCAREWAVVVLDGPCFKPGVGGILICLPNHNGGGSGGPQQLGMTFARSQP